MAATYRLFHVSDLHLSALPHSLAPGATNPNWPHQAMHEWMTGHDEAVLEALARFVYREAFAGTKRDKTATNPVDPLFDYVLVTGDLASSGFDDDLKRAYRALGEYQPPLAGPLWHHEFGTTVEPTLGFLRDAIKAMPGNHDRYDGSLSCWPGSAAFDGIFNDASRPVQFWTAQQGAQPWLLVQQQGARPLAIIAADFTLPPKDYGEKRYFGWFGQGRAYDAVVTELKTKTTEVIDAFKRQAAQDPACAHPVILWAIHFDPTTSNRTLKLLEMDRFRDAARDMNIPYFLCGHTHESTNLPLSQSTIALIAGSATQACTYNRHDSTEVSNDFQLLEINVPDKPSEPLRLDVSWYRYKEFKSNAPAGSPGRLGRFVRIARP